MEEKLYVIGEIVASKDSSQQKTSTGARRYTFQGRLAEWLWLHDDSPALVRQEQLRYVKGAKYGDKGFFVGARGVELQEWDTIAGSSVGSRLIIDPHKPPEPESAWDRWLNECPVCDERVKAWVAKMPRA